MKFCEKLIQLRKQKGYSQESLAEKLDVSRQAISRWEAESGYPDIELLPALPTQWKDGSISGIVARGGFEVSFEWNNMKFKKGTVKSNCGGRCSLSYKGKYIGVSDEKGDDVKTVFENGIVTFETVPGATYNIY